MTITGETTTGGPIARDHRRGPLEEQGSIGYAVLGGGPAGLTGAYALGLRNQQAVVF